MYRGRSRSLRMTNENGPLFWSGPCSSLFAIRVENGFAVGTGILFPFRRHGLADFAEAFLQCVGGLHDGHLVARHDLDLLVSLGFGSFPAAIFGGFRGSKHALANVFRQTVERRLGDDHDVARKPGLRVVEVR